MVKSLISKCNSVQWLSADGICTIYVKKAIKQDGSGIYTLGSEMVHVCTIIIQSCHLFGGCRHSCTACMLAFHFCGYQELRRNLWAPRSYGALYLGLVVQKHTFAQQYPRCRHGYQTVDKISKDDNNKNS